MPEESLVQPEQEPTEAKTSKLAKLGRFALGSAVGLSIAATGTFIGYEMAVNGAENQSFGVIPDRVGEVFGAIYGSVVGTLIGIAVGAGISK